MFYSLKDLSKNEKYVFYFTLFYIILFTLHAISKKNGEFIFYSITMLLLLEFGIYLNKKVRFPEFIIIGLSLLGLMHILGGNVKFGQTRLYEIFFFNGLLRYDNIVHIFGSAMSTLVLNSMFFSFAIEKLYLKLGLFYFALILMTLGVGVLNELVEFITVIFFNAEEQVGGYINNTVDLVYNLIGALISIIIIDSYRLHKIKK